MRSILHWSVFVPSDRPNGVHLPLEGKSSAARVCRNVRCSAPEKRCLFFSLEGRSLGLVHIDMQLMLGSPPSFFSFRRDCTKYQMEEFAFPPIKHAHSNVSLDLFLPVEHETNPDRIITRRSSSRSTKKNLSDPRLCRAVIQLSACMTLGLQTWATQTKQRGFRPYSHSEPGGVLWLPILIFGPSGFLTRSSSLSPPLLQATPQVAPRIIAVCLGLLALARFAFLPGKIGVSHDDRALQLTLFGFPSPLLCDSSRP